MNQRQHRRRNTTPPPLDVQERGRLLFELREDSGYLIFQLYEDFGIQWGGPQLLEQRRLSIQDATDDMLSTWIDRNQTQVTIAGVDRIPRGFTVQVDIKTGEPICITF